MPLCGTFARYLATEFLKSVGVVLAIMIVLVFIVDLMEMQNEFGDKAGITFATTVNMSLLKLPYVMEETIPFATLFGACGTFVRLSRSSELIVARAAGVSAWQFLSPAILIGLLGGVFLITLYNPFAAAMIERYERLESRYTSGSASLLDVSASGLWLRQLNHGEAAIINALSVGDQGAHLKDVSIFIFNENGTLSGRIKAKEATLEPGRWLLKNGELRALGQESKTIPVAEFSTPLTRSQIQDSFASPKTMSFWRLPRFIALAEQAGFSAIRHRLHFYSMLATPLLLCAMILLAAVFALRVQRGRGMGGLIVGAVLGGFLLYFASRISSALALSGIVPVTLAAWAPAAAATLLGVAFLLHLEDG